VVVVTVAEDVLARYAACPVLSPMQIRWLRTQGVPTSALHRPDVLVRAAVVYQGGGFLFEAEAAPGEPTVSAVVALAYDEDGVAGDLVAWSPRTGMVATWLRRISYLGDAFGPRIDADGALLVHATPLEWLKSDRDGIAVVDADLAREQLRDAGPFAVDSNPDFGLALRQILTPRAPRILVLMKEAA
jgi:hypothetical protein